MKKFIKKNLRIILIAGVTAIICISGTAFATGYFAKDIIYKNGKSVEDSLNELYEKNNINYVIKNGKLNDNLSNLGTYSEGGYNCSVEYNKNDYIQLNQTGGTTSHAYNPYWKLIIKSNQMKEYSKMYIDFSYDYMSTYKGLNLLLNMYDGMGNKLTSNKETVSGYFCDSKKFDRKTVVTEIDTGNVNTAELILQCYTCDGGTSIACIYNLWFE